MTIQWGQRPHILYCKPCDFTKSIKCKKPYVVEGTNNGSVTTRGDITFGGREIGNVHRHLEGVNKRPLGLASSQRVQDSLCVSTQTKHTANTTSISFGAGSSNKRRGQAATGEGSGDSGTRQSRWLLFKPLLSTQEEWPNETSDQPETVERVGVHRTLQDGGNPNPEGHSAIRRLVCESRSERRLLHNPNRLQPPAVPEVHAGRGELSVHMPPLWPVLCPPYIHQGTEASDDTTPFMGVKIIVYIDDMLILAETPEQASQHLETLMWILRALGFIVNHDKSVLKPTQEIEFLGMVVNSVSMEISLPGEKLRQIRGEATKLLSQSQVSARLLSKFIGKLNAAAQAVVPAPLLYRHLQGNLRSTLASGNHGYENVTTLSQQAQEELSWWKQHLQTWNGRCLIRGREQILISSDASLQGWGATCSGTQTGGPWSELEKTWHINCLELQAASLAVQTFLRDRSGISALL